MKVIESRSPRRRSAPQARPRGAAALSSALLAAASRWRSLGLRARRPRAGRAAAHGHHRRRQLGHATARPSLTGTVNPERDDTSYYFQYGVTRSYGSQTAIAAAGSGTRRSRSRCPSPACSR